jgi:hypothetical protein
MDLNVQAFRFVQEATSEIAPEQANKRATSRKGGLKGGRSRAVSLSAERRKEIAEKANRARWDSAQKTVVVSS